MCVIRQHRSGEGAPFHLTFLSLHHSHPLSTAKLPLQHLFRSSHRPQEQAHYQRRCGYVRNLHPRPSAMATIKHLYFPHIIDLIWQYLDYEGQLATRTACKNWKSRPDGRLHHVVISCFERPELFHQFDISTRDLTSLSDTAWLGELSHWHDGSAHEWIDGDYDNLGRPVEFKYSEAEKLANHLERNLVATTKIVDLIGFDLGWPHVPLHLSENTLLRDLLLDPDCVVRCFGDLADLSDFKDLYWTFNGRRWDLDPPLVDVYMYTYGTDGPLHALSPWGLSEREDVQVVNYFCKGDPTNSSPKLTSLWDGYIPQSLCPVTVIFHNGIPQDERRPPGLEPGLVAAYSDLIHGGNEVIIVGLEEFLATEDMEGYVAVVEHDVLKSRRRYEYDENDDDWLVPERSCLDNLHFMTHEEYRDHVGEELYRIHAVR